MTRRKPAPKQTPHRVAEICAVLERLAPTGLAQSWDNVGLLAGDPDAAVTRVLCCVDLTQAVAAEAVAGKHDFVVAYHPPVFKPITRITADAGGAEAAVFRCVAAGVAVYSPHTALDAAPGGTNDVLAEMCGIAQPVPLEHAESPARKFKLVTFVPQRNLDELGGALFEAGAGLIGNYSQCSFRLLGLGTFQGNDASNPVLGRRGRLEQVEEIRIEMLVSAARLPQVVAALRKAHPYEEPAFDIYPLAAVPEAGIGRQGRLIRPATLTNLARKLKKSLGVKHVQAVGPVDRQMQRAVIVVGAAGSMPFTAKLDEQTVVVTGEIRHHDALAYLRAGCCALALGHWTSERPVLASLATRLAEGLPRASVTVSQADAEPFKVL